MNVASPDLLTLLAWAEQLAAGESCAPWEAWSRAALDAEWKWKRISEAHGLLAGRLNVDQTDSILPAEELAQFVEGRLAASDLNRVEQACWQSTAQLAELVSTARFMRQEEVVGVSRQAELRGLTPPARQFAGGVSPGLELRLLELVPQAKPQQANGKPVGEVAGARGQGPGVRRRETIPANWLWPLIAAAMVLAIALSGTIGWMAATWRHSANLRQEIASGPSESDVRPQTKDDGPSLPSPITPPMKRGVPIRQESIVPRPEEPTTPIPATDSSQLGTPEPVNSAPKQVNPPAGVPKYRPRVALPAPALAFRSAQGLLLVDEGQRGKLRVAPSSFSLQEPTRVLSLAETWTTAEIPGVGSLIWEGNAEGVLSPLPDGTIEVRVTHGRVGIDHLRLGAQLRIVSGDAAWTARAAADNSTFAVVQDPRSPGLLVPRGAVTIDDIEVPGGQMIRWLDGMPQTPQALSPLGMVIDSSQSGVMPPPINPWELSWLQPPTDILQKQWRSLYGRIADRLAETDDVASELPKVLASSRDQRQTALVARWNIAAVASGTRARQIWSFLSDRRPAVRIAGVKSMLEMPPGDERLVDVSAVLRSEVGAATADRMDQWLAAAWQPGPPAKLQFEEIVQHLLHTELAVRQIAVSLLELHTAGVLRLARTDFPAYDAATSRPRREEAAKQWAAIAIQLYTPSRKGPSFANPPAASLLRPVPQNAAPLNAAPVK